MTVFDKSLTNYQHYQATLQFTGELLGGLPDQDDPNLFRFKRENERPILEGRIIKSALKEAANVRMPGIRMMQRVTEHVFVDLEAQDIGPLTTVCLDSILQTAHGPVPRQMTFECATRPVVRLSVADSGAISFEQWGLIWTTTEILGIGAGRGRGYGRFEITEWEKVGT